MTRPDIEEKALKFSPKVSGEAIDDNGDIYTTDDKDWPERFGFIKGYEEAGKDVIEHCEKRIAEYNADNMSNLFLRRAFEDVIRFVKGIPYEEYENE